MNDALQALEVKVENGGATPQGKVFAKEWNVLVEAVKALDLKEFDEAALHKFLQDNGYITEDNIPTTDLSNVVTLATEQTIQGRKNFVGGVEVNGGELVYDAEKKVWQLVGDLLVTGAITMFGNTSGFKPSTIMDAVLVDGTTIVKNAQGQLTVIGGGGGNTGGLSVADLENYLSANKYTTEDAVSSLITEKLTSYATADWVTRQGFAKQSALTAVDNRLAAVEVFFATEDNDTLVNKWAEIVAFLNATEGDTLDSILSTKANKATTLAGYGITDAYTKAEINNTVSLLNSSIATKWTQDNGKIANWDSAYGWGNHANAGYAAKTYVDTELTKYVKLAVAQSIEAQHNFVNGLKIGGLPITKSGSANNTIYLDANLAVSGAITMFGSSSTTFPTIWANIPFNPEHMSWDGSKWSVIGDGTGSVDNATVRVIVNEVLGEKGYATEKWVTDKDYATVSVVSSAISSALNPYALKTDIPTYTLRASSTIGKFYLQRNGVDSANVTINLPTSLPASDVYAWAKASSKPSYSWSEILSRPTALSQFTDDVVAGKYLPITGGTVNGSITASSVIGDLTGNADSATKLATPRTIWGQSFDGTGDISGDLTNVGNIYSRGAQNGGYAIYSSVRWDEAISIEVFDNNGNWLTTGIIVKTNGNVGIGGTTADCKLHVHGTGLFTGDVTITTGALQCYTLTGEKDTPIYHSIELGFSNRNYIDFNEYGGDFRFNQTSNGIKAELVRILPDITYINTSLYTGNITTPSITPTSGTLTVNGNLLTTGQFRLFYQGSFDGNVAHSILNYEPDPYGLLTRIYSSGAVSLQAQRETTATEFFPFYLNPLGGNVAIGGETAQEKLHVHGNIALNGNIKIVQSTYPDIRGNGSYLTFSPDDVSGSKGSIGLYRAVDGSAYEFRRVWDHYSYAPMYLGASGYRWNIIYGVNGDFSADVILPSITPTSGTLTVNGNLLTTGAITMFSQLSMKNVIDYDGLSLAQLAQIKPARFTWKDSRDTLIHAGGIADDVMQVLPEVVHRTADDKLTMDYGSAGFFIATSLIKPVIDHEHRIADLERENQQLKQQLEQLSA